MRQSGGGETAKKMRNTRDLLRREGGRKGGSVEDKRKKSRDYKEETKLQCEEQIQEQRKKDGVNDKEC